MKLIVKGSGPIQTKYIGGISLCVGVCYLTIDDINNTLKHIIVIPTTMCDIKENFSKHMFSGITLYNLNTKEKYLTVVIDNRWAT